MFSLLIFAFKLFFSNKALAGWSDQLEHINVDANLPSSSLENIIFNFLLYLLAIFTIIAVISFAIYGSMFLFGGTNKNLVDSARNGVRYSIIGIIVALSGYIIVRFIAEILSGSFSLYF